MERVYRIERLLKQNRPVSMRALAELTEVSRATLARDLEYMRDRLNAPIVWDRAARGYRLDGPYTAPGLYFTPAEIHALLILQQLVARMQPAAAADPDGAALRSLLEKALGDSGRPPDELARRVRILQIASRPIAAAHFQAVSTAILSRKRLDLTYYSRARGEETRREVSPARLVYYRDNWYLEAWCHLRDGLRSFALDAVGSAAVLPAAARDVPEARLDRELGSGYGIFSGLRTRTAVLRFTPEAARWVAFEKWPSCAARCARRSAARSRDINLEWLTP